LKKNNPQFSTRQPSTALTDGTSRRLMVLRQFDFKQFRFYPFK